MKLKKLFILLPAVVISCNACSFNNDTFSSTSINSVTFYSDNNYLITDKEMNKENILVLIVSQYCSHCENIEPLLQELKNTDFTDLTFVIISPNDVNTYKLPLSYNDSVKFYYEQGSDYVDPYFLPDGLYQYASFPTPTALYLGENRELKHILFGLNENIEGLKEDINLLITEEKAG